MSNYSFKDYFEKINETLGKIEEIQEDKIHKAAKCLGDTLDQDGLIHTFGTGH